MNNISIIGEKCFGCNACIQSCPTNAIYEYRNSEGFYYPAVAADKCVECGKCLLKCPVNTDTNSIPIKAIGLKNQDNLELMESASGGAAFLFSKAIINDGGTVCGAGYDENLHVKHFFANQICELTKFQSSKYVQSNTENSFSKIETLLKKGQTVLFIGTPCQVAGLNSFLGEDFANLYTVDLICHGVPSPGLFELFVKYLENREGSKIKTLNFRYKKKKGWGMHFYYCCENGKSKTVPFEYTKYGEDFLKKNNYRESCYCCKYANYRKRPGDITIGDYWRLMKVNPHFYDKRGVSSIIFYTPKGQILFDKIKKDCQWFECEVEDIVKGQDNLKSSTQRPDARDDYYSSLDDNYFYKNKATVSLIKRIYYMMPVFIVTLLKRLKAIVM